MSHNPISARRLPWDDLSESTHDYQGVRPADPFNPIAPWPMPPSTRPATPPPSPPTSRKPRGLRPKARPTSPPHRPQASCPPPLPPWPPSPDSFQAPAIAAAPRHVRWDLSPKPPAAKPRAVARPAAAPMRQPAVPVATGPVDVARPSYGYSWRTGHARPACDNRIAGGDVFEVVRKRRVQDLQALIEQTPSVLVKADPEYARTPLGWAVLHQRLDMVRMLVSAMHAYGCDRHGELDAQGLDFRTPLMLAIDATGPDAVALVDTLLAAGASIHLRTRRVAGTLGSFMLISRGSDHKGQDVAEYAVRKNRALALHQILKRDEQTPLGTGKNIGRLHIDALIAKCPKDEAQFESLHTVLRAARARRLQIQRSTPASELEAQMYRLGVADPGELTRVSS